MVSYIITLFVSTFFVAPVSFVSSAPAPVLSAAPAAAAPAASVPSGSVASLLARQGGFKDQEDLARGKKGRKDATTARRQSKQEKERAARRAGTEQLEIQGSSGNLKQDSWSYRGDDDYMDPDPDL